MFKWAAATLLVFVFPFVGVPLVIYLWYKHKQAEDEIARKDGPLVQQPETTGGDNPGVPASMKNKEPKNESEFIQRLKTLSGQN